MKIVPIWLDPSCDFMTLYLIGQPACLDNRSKFWDITKSAMRERKCSYKEQAFIAVLFYPGWSFLAKTERLLRFIDLQILGLIWPSLKLLNMVKIIFSRFSKLYWIHDHFLFIVKIEKSGRTLFRKLLSLIVQTFIEQVA